MALAVKRSIEIAGRYFLVLEVNTGDNYVVIEVDSDTYLAQSINFPPVTYDLFEADWTS